MCHIFSDTGHWSFRSFVNVRYKVSALWHISTLLSSVLQYMIFFFYQSKIELHEYELHYNMVKKCKRRFFCVTYDLFTYTRLCFFLIYRNETKQFESNSYTKQFIPFNFKLIQHLSERPSPRLDKSLRDVKLQFAIMHV